MPFLVVFGHCVLIVIAEVCLVSGGLGGVNIGDEILFVLC